MLFDSLFVLFLVFSFTPFFNSILVMCQSELPVTCHKQQHTFPNDVCTEEIYEFWCNSVSQIVTEKHGLEPMTPQGSVLPYNWAEQMAVAYGVCTCICCYRHRMNGKQRQGDYRKDFYNMNKRINNRILWLS